jgi:hypothetical protein
MRWRRPGRGWLILLVLGLSVGGWYLSLQPSDTRDWTFDVRHGVGATRDGEQVTLTHVRDFVWHDATRADEAWVTRTVDLGKLASVDMLTSVWDSPDIAHLLVSFGFSDGQRIVFSVETRKESHESFNVIGGFFRQFELVLIAGTEDDLIKLRTNHRQEDVRLYPVTLSASQRRDLFLAYVDLAQRLQAQPAFYNTLTANCTTTVYELAQVLRPGLSLDWRLVMSGHLVGYVDEMGGFADDMPLETRIAQAAITEKALAYTGADYSAGIRAPVDTDR